jgi:hypothetical protein
MKGAAAGTDLSDGKLGANPKLQLKVDQGLPPIVEDVRTVRVLHFGALIATGITVLFILGLLTAVVCAFTTNLKNSTKFMALAVSQTPSSDTSGDDRIIPGNFRKLAVSDKDDSKDEKSKDGAKEKGDADSRSMSDRAHLYSMLSSYQTSISTSSVAVISILVVATTVIAVSLLRAALDVKPHDPSAVQARLEPAQVVAEPAKDSGITWPGFEFVKNAADVVLSLFRRKPD